MSILRSIGAVFAGLVTVFVLSEGTDYLMRTSGMFPAFDQGVAAMSNDMFIVAFGYRALAGVIGGFVAAALAPARAMTHALVLGAIGLGLSTLGAIVMWGIGPAWYPIALAVVALPASWLGGWIQQLRGGRAQA